MKRLLALALPLAILTTGCVSLSERQAEAVAPEPTKPVDAARFFTGRWYEIARTPMKLTDGCVAGTTDYFKGSDGQLMDKDACREGSPTGKEKAFQGAVTLLNTDNTKMRVDYKVMGLFTSPRVYWILDHDETYGWFVVSNPNFDQVSVFSRNARPSASEVAMLTAKAKATGYDVSKLEFPARFQSGQ
jgi:apolipoprotein D and lipocalin family protein